LLTFLNRLRFVAQISAGLIWPSRYESYAGQHAAYWKIKENWGRARVKFLNAGLRRDSSIRQFSGTRRVLVDLATASLARAWLVIPGVALAIILDWLTQRGRPLLLHLHVALPGISHDATVSVLSTASQITVVTLGLYFAAFSIVVSSGLYSQVPEEVRSLLLRERVSTTFMGSLAVTAVFCLAMLALQAAGYDPRYGTLALVAIGAAFCVFSFARFAPTLFRLFDPKYLLVPVREELVRHVQGVLFSDPLSLDASMQDYHRRAALVPLTALETISHLSEKLVSTTWEVVDDVLKLLQWYAFQKSRIHIESEWWPRIPAHENWFTTDYTKLSVYLNAETRMRPREQRDRLWLERIFARLLANSTRTIGGSDTQSTFALLMNGLARASWVMGNALCVDECLFVQRVVFEALVDLARDPVSDLDGRRAFVPVGAADGFGVICANLILGLQARIDNLKPSDLDRAFDAALHDRLVDVVLPEEMYTIIDEAKRAWNLERNVYGHTITPPSFFAKSAGQVMNKAVIDRIKRATGTVRGLLIPLGKNIEDAALRTLVLQGALDVSVRARRLIDESLTALRDDAVASEALEALHQRADASYAEALEQFCRAALALSPKHAESSPDFLGQAYYVVAQEVFDAICRGDVAALARWSPAYFLLLSHTIKRVGSASSRSTYALAEVTTDAVLLAGYAIAASGALQIDVWTAFRDAFDQFLSNHNERMLEAIAALFATHGGPGSRSSLVRHSWGVAFGDMLRARGLMADGFLYSMRGFSEAPSHRDPLISLALDEDMDRDVLFAIFAIRFVRRRHPSAFDAYVPVIGEFLRRYNRELCTRREERE